MKHLKSIQEFYELLEENREGDLFIYKHSPRCGLCQMTAPIVETFLLSHQGVDMCLVDVLADRELSMQIAEHTGVKHESPQVLMFHEGKVVWSASHGEINSDSLESAFRKFAEAN